MPLSYASEGCKFEEDLQDPREAHHLEPGQLVRAEEEGEEDAPFPSCFSSSTFPLTCIVFQDASEEEAAAGSQSSPSACSSPRALDAAPWSQSEEESTSSQEEEGPHTSQEPAEAQAPPQETLQEKVADLVYFLLHKYRAKMLTSQAEILREVLDDNLEHFPVAFRRACECLQLVFGLEVQEAEPNGDSYVLVTTLGLTYDGLMRPEEIMPKTGLLVIVLAVILLNGDRSPEERMWEALGAVGVFAGLEHIIYGEPRALLTEVWVQEQYLEYQQVPHSDPPRYEFLWGPRAYAETNKVDVLEYFIRVNSRNSRSF
ncbi:melanoma-associated antigen 10-like [Talpa occidentalis]|uniref:melanoma-associated antigen 10-like n=1 Tax=Talpa occidentalis TaxID=50954 RepID=UPI00188FB827|nr:melanoma-associated antigen 10-like [Talpa occidentalis]